MRYPSLDSAVEHLDAADVARHLAAGKNINQRYDTETESGGYSTLLGLYASLQERAHVIFLLQQGADPNIPDSDGETPLHHAAGHGDAVMTFALLSNGANPNLKNRHGWTPLHLAAAKGHFPIVKLLVTLGADKQAMTNVGATPLLLAAKDGYGAIAKELAAPLDIERALRRDIEAARNRSR